MHRCVVCASFIAHENMTRPLGGPYMYDAWHLRHRVGVGPACLFARLFTPL